MIVIGRQQPTKLVFPKSVSNGKGVGTYLISSKNLYITRIIPGTWPSTQPSPKVKFKTPFLTWSEYQVHLCSPLQCRYYCRYGRIKFSYPLFSFRLKKIMMWFMCVVCSRDLTDLLNNFKRLFPSSNVKLVFTFLNDILTSLPQI